MQMLSEVTIEEMQESFNIKQRMRRDTAWAKDFELVNGARKLFAGRLLWDENYGYDIIWDTDKPEMADRPDFAYILDSILEEKYSNSIPQYGDATDAGIAGE